VALPPSLQGPFEPDSDPKVRADTQSICGQIVNGRHGSWGEMAHFTRRWGQLAWLYEHDDREGMCQIAELMREAAKA
jgi:hypothetical protein